MPNTSPIRPTDDQARTLASDLIANASFGALAVLHPQTKLPFVSRISVGRGLNREIVSLMSDLSTHTQALKADGRCSLLLGEPGPKGDPLTHPRITLQAQAIIAPKSTEQYTDLRRNYLEQHPKSKLYIDFADFNFFIFDVSQYDLNGGFGKAFKLTPSDFH